MKINELEKITGIPRSTIHHYINCGLLHRPQKTGHTMAYYDATHVQRLEAVQKIKIEYLKTAKTSRIPIAHIKSKLGETFSTIKTADKKSKVFQAKSGSKRDEKKEKIMQATLKLYSNRGYFLTNIRDVARAVGISPPTFYRYFKDKKELFVETIEYVVRNFKSEIKEALKEEKDPAIRSIIMFKIFYKHYPNMGEILNQLRSGVIIGDPWAKKRLSRLYREMMSDLLEEIKRAMSQGTLRPVDPYLLTYFNLAINELALSLASMDKSYSLDDIMLFVGDMMDHAFLTPEKRKSFSLFYKPKK